MSGSAIYFSELAALPANLARNAPRVLAVARGPAFTPLRRAVFLSAAYYVGAMIGFLFQSPGTPQSVLWLPNSILLAALLMTPARLWVAYVAAALPAHLLVAWQTHAPLGAMALLFLTNCADAVLGATAVRFAARGRWRLDSLRNLIVFFACGSYLGPALISFLDAGITVLTGWGTDYWTAYVTRVRANTLTNVILVPAIVGTLSLEVSEWRRASVSRYLEALVVLAAVLVVSALVFSRAMHDGAIAWFYLPMALLLWPAVRFGPGTTGWTLLLVATTSSWNALRGVGPFGAETPAGNIESLQFFLLCVSIPLLSLAMVIKEREEVTSELVASRNATRVSIDTVRDLAGRFIAAQEDERARVARELHDGVSQHVAEMAITLGSMRRMPAAQAGGLDADFLRLYDQTSGLFESVRSLSHQLHPSVLRHAGLVPAMESLCTTFGTQHEIAVTFTSEDVEPLPESVALCAYRVAQETLRNIAEHAEARRVNVRLARAENDLLLTVTDDGRGFDPTTARQRSHGLGLVSMEERVRLAHGELTIRSESTGTSITARLPRWPAAQ
jgi:signal transduction histidine kinase